MHLNFYRTYSFIADTELYVNFPFYFLLPIHGRESVVFGTNFRKGDFEGFTRFEAPST